MLLLIVLFVYAFFKFTWAFRQYNYCLILVGCAPAPDHLDRTRAAGSPSGSRASRARPAGTSIAASGRTTSASAALSWFIHPWLFMLLTVWVVLVLYRREFHSRLLHTLAITSRGGGGAAAAPILSPGVLGPALQ